MRQILLGGFHLSVTVTRSTFRGWESLELTNGLLEVQVVPEIGGRIIQLKLENFDYFWVNERLVGKPPTATGLGPNGAWLNYGGSKLWPAPQGWGSDDLWPGPPDAVLDGSPHRGSVISGSEELPSVQLTSQQDKRSGIQFTRKVTLYPNAAHVSIGCTMENIDTKPRRWGIWQVTQHNTANRKDRGYDENVHVYCPINSNSKHPNGYRVIYGSEKNPEFEIVSGMMSVRYLHRVGKIGMDCSAGWYALVNGTYGYVFVERFDWMPGRDYPDDASFELWTQGEGAIQAYGKNIEMSGRLDENPYLLETEVLGPLAALNPGESTSLRTDWYAAKIGKHLPVIACSAVGVTCKPLQVSKSGRTLSIQDGHFGVFERGEAALAFLDADGAEIDRGSAREIVSPTVPLASKELSKLTEDVKVPSDPTEVSVIILPVDREVVGYLGSARLS